MRNAPIDAEGKTRLYSGHRLTSRLPWFRGIADAPMEVEAQALCEVVRKYLFPSEVAMALDIHSGFGAHDRLWFPFANRLKPLPHLAEVMAIKLLFATVHPYHIYHIEPVAKSYVIHGDLWDYLYEEKLSQNNGFFLPWTLEIGSWIWLRKNPLNLFHRFGLYHPILPHRKQRVLRRHLMLLDFMQKLLLHPKLWLAPSPSNRADLQKSAMDLWFANGN
jgi:hypothetical protein